MNFYVSKYPVIWSFNKEKGCSDILPAGTVFKIDSINLDCFNLKLAAKDDDFLIQVGCDMLDKGFTMPKIIRMD